MDSYRPNEHRSAADDNDQDAFRGRDRRDSHYNNRGRHRSSHSRQPYNDSYHRGRDRDYGHGSDDRGPRPWRPSPQRGYHSNEAEEPYHGAPVAPESTGENDVSPDGKAIQFLLIRGFKSSTDGAVLARGLEKLYREQATNDQGPPAIGAAAASPSTGAVPGSIKRVLIVRDRRTERSMGFGFVEFFTIADATAALNKARLLGERCTVSSKQIQLDVPHMGVFTNIATHRTPLRFTFQLRAGEFYEYHDNRYFVVEHAVNQEPPALPPPPPPHRPASPPKGLAGPALKRSNADLFNLGDTDSRPKKSKTSSSGPTAYLERLKQQQAEARDANQESDIGQRQSFVITRKVNDKMQKTCLLCKADLADSVVILHCQESQLHLKNLQDSEKIASALAQIAQLGYTEDQTLRIPPKAAAKPVDSAAGSAYRDRAKERRQDEARSQRIHFSLGPATAAPTSQTDATTTPTPISTSTSTATADPAPPSAAEDVYGIGFTMLKNAGYKPGQALGTGSSKDHADSATDDDAGGITAPISQNMYAQGVGLGHEASKQGDSLEEADRRTKGDRASFLERTRELARERYERMG